MDQIHAGCPGQDWVSHVDLILDIKAYDAHLRQKLIDRISELVKVQSHDAGVKVPPETPVSVRAPLINNSHSHTVAIRNSFARFFSEEKLGSDLSKHPCEDFSRLATAYNWPYVFWFVGREAAHRFDEAVRNDAFLDKNPINHSPHNAHVLHPTLETGIEAIALAALTFLTVQSEAHLRIQGV